LTPLLADTQVSAALFDVRQAQDHRQCSLRSCYKAVQRLHTFARPILTWAVENVNDNRRFKSWLTVGISIHSMGVFKIREEWSVYRESVLGVGHRFGQPLIEISG
jgi:hypothetical protein